MIRPIDKFDIDHSPSVCMIGSILLLIAGWLLSLWLVQSLLLSFLITPLVIFFLVGMAVVLMAITAPVLIVVFYASALIATPFLCLFKKI